MSFGDFEAVKNRNTNSTEGWSNLYKAIDDIKLSVEEVISPD